MFLVFEIREEPRLRVFENRVLGKVFGCKKKEVTGDRIQLHVEVCDLYCLPYNIRVII